MRQFSLATRVYIWFVVAMGALAFGYEALIRENWRDPITLAIGCVLSVALAYKSIIFYRQPSRKGKSGDSEENQATMSLGFVPTFFLLFHLGILAGMLAACAGVLITLLYPRRSHYYQIFFSMAAVVLSSFTAGLVLHQFYLAPGDWDPLLLARTGNVVRLLAPVGGIVLGTFAYYLTNTLIIATVMALIAGKNPIRVWRSHFIWIGPGYLAGASCATISLALLPHIDIRVLSVGNYLVALAFALISIPIPLMVFLSLRYHRLAESARNEKLEALGRSKEELERSNAELQRSKEELQQLYTSTVESLALAIDAKDRYTKEHIQRVKGFAVCIAQELGLTGNDLKAVETGALLHDIGKLAVPEHILTKPGRLSEEEFAKVKAHPDMGARILEPVQFPFPVMPIVRHHHERWDGKGYPDGLAGEEIPLGGRILAVADVYDALTSDRSYRQGWSHERAVTHLQEHSGSHFDPQVVEAFMSVLEKNPELAVRKPDYASSVIPGTPLPETVAMGINRASFEYLALYEISQVAAATLNLSETLSLVAEKVRNIFNASACVLFLKEEGTPQGAVMRARRMHGEGIERFQDAYVSLGVGLTGGVAASGQGTLGIFDPHDLILPNRVPEEELAAEEPYRSVLIAPLVADANVIGTVNLYQRRAHAFDQEDLRVLQAVAVQAGRAIQNAIEFDRTLESALTDSLTGLYNARHLNLFLERELARASAEERVLTLLVLDLDNFKPVNDRYGHTRGNEVLRDLGKIFQSVLRSGDLVARYAGDEFVIVLPGTGPGEARHVIEKIRNSVRQYDPRPVGSDTADLEMGVSVGAASFPQDATEASALITAADRAMFRDKRQRKGHAVSEEEMTTGGLRLVA